MFGFRSAVPSGAHRSLLDAENALASQALGHPDGWGIGWFVDDDAYVVKHSAAAHACDRFQRASQRLSSHTFIVHVRRATIGRVDPLNAHPFRFGRWLFAHNGTLLDHERLHEPLMRGIHPRFGPMILGDTDSEMLFFWLLSRLLARGIDPSGHEPAPAPDVAQIVRDGLLEVDALAQERGARRPLLNVLLTDGRSMIAHRAGMSLHLSTQKRWCADAPTCPAVKVCLEARRPQGHPVNHLIVASEPIGAENHWEIIEDGSTIALDAGFLLTELAPPAGWVAPVLPESMRIPSTPSLSESA